MDRKNRMVEIQDMIDNRVKNNDIVKCLFQILLLNKDVKSIVKNVLIKNGCDINIVDTISGCWNLNDDWYEVSDIEAAVEYCGVYPIKWNIEDVVTLEELYNNRDIYIKVLWKIEDENGTIKYIPNN